MIVGTPKCVYVLRGGRGGGGGGGGHMDVHSDSLLSSQSEILVTQQMKKRINKIKRGVARNVKIR